MSVSAAAGTAGGNLLPPALQLEPWVRHSPSSSVLWASLNPRGAGRSWVKGSVQPAAPLPAG